MRASSEVVEGNKVRLSVHVDESEVDEVLGEAVRTLSRQAKVPGFRPGKVPRQVLEARMGGAVALRAEALREAIPDFYARALSEAELDPISSPEIDITAGKESGALAFDAVLEVRPLVSIPGYAGLRVTVPSPVVAETEVDAQIDRLRETEAELVDVDRPAIDGDNVSVDLHGTVPGGQEVISSDDVLYEVGSGRVVPELDVQLRGAKIGDVLAFSTPARDDTPEIAFRVLVKGVKQKKLPEANDAWAQDASEFSTLEALRDDLRTRIGRVKVVQAQMSLRDGAMSALTELVEDAEVPETLVDAETQERLHDFGHRLEQQRVTVPQFLEAMGRTEADFVAQIRAEARQAVKGDLALRALAEAENLDVSEDELDTELQATAERLGVPVDTVRDRLTRAGRMAGVRSEQRKAKALTWLLDHVELVDDEGAPVSRDLLQVDQGADGEAAAPDGEDVAHSADEAVATVTDGDVTNGEADQ
jgi:trigger factor